MLHSLLFWVAASFVTVIILYSIIQRNKGANRILLDPNIKQNIQAVRNFRRKIVTASQSQAIEANNYATVIEQNTKIIKNTENRTKYNLNDEMQIIAQMPKQVSNTIKQNRSAITSGIRKTTTGMMLDKALAERQ